MPRYLIDTNILLRLSQQRDSQYSLVQAAVAELNKQRAELCFSLQNIAEFWNVCTRPSERNGYGLSIDETRRRVEAIERAMTLLADSGLVYSLWRELVVANNVRGVQVHDAHLAATMQAHGAGHILTLNEPDFKRYTALQVVHPSAVLASATGGR